MSEHVPDLRLVGTSEMAGGVFGKIRITGDAKLTGRVACRHLSITGTAELQGDLEAGRVKFTGEVRLAGSIRGGKLGGMGELRAESGIGAEEIVMSGLLHSGGPIEAEKLDIRGVVETGGVVNAEHATIRLYGPSRAGEIVGGTIIVRRSRGLSIKGWMQPSVETGLSAGMIEGDKVYIEYTRADLVRGNTVELGPGCEIGRVEYREGFEAHAKSKTGAAVKL